MDIQKGHQKKRGGNFYATRKNFYDKILESCDINQNASYLEFLIEANHAAQEWKKGGYAKESRTEQQEFLQVLSIACTMPKVWFKSPKEADSEQFKKKDFCKYAKTADQVYNDLSKHQRRQQVVYYYLERSQRYFSMELAIPSKAGIEFLPVDLSKILRTECNVTDEKKQADSAPANDEGAPANDEGAPANDKDAPANDKDAPANDKDAPANDKDAPANDEDAPANDEDAPANNEDEPANDEGAPANDKDEQTNGKKLIIDLKPALISVRKHCLEYERQLSTLLKKVPNNEASKLDNYQFMDSVEKFLRLCLVKPRLQPMMVAIIIREAQYQMMGLGSHARSFLLPTSKEFPSSTDLPLCLEREIAQVTFDTCTKIRDSLAKDLNFRITCIGDAFFKLYESEKNTSKSCQHNAAFRKIIKNKIPFAAPNCDIKDVVIDIACRVKTGSDQSGIDDEKQQVLTQLMPRILWGNEEINKLCAKIKLDGSALALLKEYRNLMDPENYFWACGKDEMAEKLKTKCPSLFTKKDSGERDQPITEALCNIRHFFKLHDLMPETLFVGNAVRYTLGLKKHLPKYYKNCQKRLEKALSEYRQDEIVKKVAQVEEWTSQDEKRLKRTRKDPEREDPILNAAIAQVAVHLTSDMAINFITKCVVPTLKNSDKLDRSFRSLLEAELKRLVGNEIDLKDNVACYLLVKETLERALDILEVQTMRSIISLSWCTVDVPEKVSGGKALNREDTTAQCVEPGGNTPE